MKSLLANATERLTGYKCRSDFRSPISVAFDEREVRALRLSYLREYELKVSLSVLYKAYTSDRFSAARQAAERSLHTELYRDVLVAIDRAVHAASDGDRDATVEILLTLRKEIVG